MPSPVPHSTWRVSVRALGRVMRAWVPMASALASVWSWEAELEPVGIGGPLVDEELAGGDEIHVAVVVEVGPFALGGGRELREAGAVGGVMSPSGGPLGLGVVAVEHRVVLLAKARVGVDGGEVEVEVAVVIVVRGGGAGVALRYHTPHSWRSSKLKGGGVCRRHPAGWGGPAAAEEAALGLVAAGVHMGEVAGEEVEVPVVIKVSPACPDGVPLPKPSLVARALRSVVRLARLARPSLTQRTLGMRR